MAAQLARVQQQLLHTSAVHRGQSTAHSKGACRRNATVRIQVHPGAGRPAGAARHRPVVQHVHPPVPGQHGNFNFALRVRMMNITYIGETDLKFNRL